MGAKDNVNDEQFIDFYHSSFSAIPPHLNREYVGLRGSILYGGTKYSAMDRATAGGVFAPKRGHIHHYKIPKSMIRPEIWADDNYNPNLSSKHSGLFDFAGPAGPTLWENIPAPISEMKPGEVYQYRNHVEDPGTISYAINTDDVHNDRQYQPSRYPRISRVTKPIKYVGVEDYDGD